MNYDGIFIKVVIIGFIGVVCFVASLLVLELVVERQDRFAEAKQEIAEKWGKEQFVAGPLIIIKKTTAEGISNNSYVLPQNLRYEIELIPEIRSRGIFKSVVYVSKLKASGSFAQQDVFSSVASNQNEVVFSLPITDTKGIENQFDLTWNGVKYPFQGGAGMIFQESSGLNAVVPVGRAQETIPFSFEIEFKGSEGISVAPVGKETVIAMFSSWPSPKFIGSYLPSEREISESGFSAEWKISSLGRPYPQTWEEGAVSPQQLIDSGAGVEFHEPVDGYDMTFRSVRYAILFIIITFATFFLFDVLLKIRIHPIQYLLIGSALSLFYVLLLSLSEQIGFLFAYITATTMIALMITLYSSFVLKSKKRAIPIFSLLVILYSYLYFVLRIEDYALLFGSLLLFIFLSVLMYTTRHIDWFALGKKEQIG